MKPTKQPPSISPPSPQNSVIPLIAIDGEPFPIPRRHGTPFRSGKEAAPTSRLGQWIDGFRPYVPPPTADQQRRFLGVPDAHLARSGNNGRSFNVWAANAGTVNSGLSRELKGRHLQMIAIGGSIGTGLFVTSGISLAHGGPASVVLAHLFIGINLYCTMQALGELAVTFPVSGSFSAFSTRFIDPSWGFAMGWNYALQWLVVLPLEVIAASFTISYWNRDIDKAIFATLFLATIVAINLMTVKGYGEAEYIFSITKVTAVVGFILLGIVINIGGTVGEGYIGGKYWQDPGAFNNGFKGFCSVFSTAAFAFAGTELVGLAAAETANPRKSLPVAIKQVFWRISLFYILSLALVGMLVPYSDPRLLGGSSAADATASPFVIAIESAGIAVLPSVMNAVILLAVISVGNSAVFGSSRTLASLADQHQAPKILGYVDRRGRPLVAIIVASAIGLLSYLSNVDVQAQIFQWLLSISALSTLFTWMSICVAHIRFRQAWAYHGRPLSHLAFRAQLGSIGSWIGLMCNVVVLASQLWIAASPVELGDEPMTVSDRVQNFLATFLAVPLVFAFWIGHRLWYRSKYIRVADMDIDTGRREAVLALNMREDEERRGWPIWKKVYRALC